MVERRGGEMGPARGLEILEARAVDAPAELLERGGHAPDPRLAVGAVGIQPLREASVGGVDAVAEDVEVLPEWIDGRQLDRGHEPHAVLACRRLRLGDAVDGVVVAERQELHAGRGSRGDDGVRGERSVGMDGVRLQVEGGSRHGGAA
jgi:hypothetical protein